MTVHELIERLLEIPNQNADVMNRNIMIDTGSALIVIPVWQTMGKSAEMEEVFYGK